MEHPGVTSRLLPVASIAAWEIHLTSLAAWPGIDSRGASTMYIVSDSRLSWPGSPGHWDCGVKVFACKESADIFGYYGDVLVPSMVLPRLAEAPVLSDNDGSDTRHSTVYALVKSSADVLPVSRKFEFGIVHASRHGKRMKSQYRLWHLRWSSIAGWSDVEVPIGPDSALLIHLGSGKRVIRNNTTSSQAELGVVSRGVFTGFCDGLTSSDDPTSGGAPQLVGLYRHGAGRYFGIVYYGRKYYRGIESPSLDLPDLQWKNELFENCDPQTGARLPGAQAQPRLRKGR